MTILKGQLHRIVWLIGLVLPALSALSTPTRLITGTSQLKTSAGETFHTSLSYLTDLNPATYWQSKPNSDGNWIQVDLTGSSFRKIDLSDGSRLVVQLVRHDKTALQLSNGISAGNPTAFLVQVSDDGTTWRDFGNTAASPLHTHVYFLMRGNSTTEYSEPITSRQSFRYIRFTATQNNCKTLDSQKHPDVAVSGLQIWKLSATDTEYPNGMADRFHFTTDFSRTYAGHTFENTKGPVDSRNRSSSLDGWTDWSGFDADGHWTKDTATMRASGADIPDFSFITSANDTTDHYVQTGRRQRTHTTEHILYAIPGDAVALYPYYDLGRARQYEENFSHWYNFKTGGHVTTPQGERVLDFLIDPSLISYSDQYGYYAGTGLPLHNDMADDGNSYVYIWSVADYKQFVQRVNNGEYKLNARLMVDLDFSGETGIETICGGITKAEYDGSASYDREEKKCYEGIFEGNGHKISNLKIERLSGSNIYYVGIFGLVGGATIRNLRIDNTCVFHAYSHVGLVGRYSEYASGPLRFQNVVVNAYIQANNNQAAGLLGGGAHSAGYDIYVENCGVGGTIIANGSSPYAAGLLGYTGNPSARTAHISNSFSNATITGITNSESLYHGKATLTNCYDRYGQSGTSTAPTQANTDEFVSRLNTYGMYWTKDPADSNTPMPIRAISSADRLYGSTATFFYPRDPYQDEGELHGLPEEYVIAADFSQSFDQNRNIVRGNPGTMVEPTIAFRHIFRVRDGKAFADKNMADKAGNAAYIKSTRRVISARAYHPFQVRMDAPVPVPGHGIRSRWYYKINNHDYRRVCSSRIEVENKNTGATVTGMFHFDTSDLGKITGKGSRYMGGVKYDLCAGSDGQYYRMIACDSLKAAPGTYVVRLIGMDVDDKDITLADGSGKLVVQEFEITFLPERRAFMADAEQLAANPARYVQGDIATLQSICGAAAAKVDYDGYLELTGNSDYTVEVASSGYDQSSAAAKGNMYKFPVGWSHSGYAFGYNVRHDFNMYLLADHCAATPYHRTAVMWPSSKNFGKGGGLFDRRFYDTKGEQRGYFYYVNAASDPGVMARLSIDRLCSGSTIYVSAWLAEFSQSDEVANLCFNFIGVTKEVKDSRGNIIHPKNERVPLHSFVTGYVPCAGIWQKVYYSFVPNFTGMEITNADIDHYELELDNNCRSSEGADYAVDDIQLYVARPLVYSEQPQPLCTNIERAVDVKVEIPYEVLLQSMGVERCLDNQKPVVTNLVYTFLDSVIYHRTLLPDKSNYKEAFEAAQLHYQYDPTNPSKDQKYGYFKFSNKYDDADYHLPYVYRTYAEDPSVFNIALTDTIEGAEHIVFNTHPDHDGLRAGKQYIIALCTMPDSHLGDVTAADFDIESSCAKKCLFQVQTKCTVKLDGVVQQDQAQMEVCVNQSPVVQVTLYGVDNNKPANPNTGTGPIVPIEVNAYFDWYYGTHVEYMDAEKYGVKLEDAVLMFRDQYPNATTVDVPTNEVYTAAMHRYLHELCQPDPVTGRAKLLLRQSAFVFPPATAPDDDPNINQVVLHALAIPINYFDTAYTICSEPTEISIRVWRRAPIMKNGLPGIPYPDHMSDVPLRIGIDHLDAVRLKDKARSKLNIPVRLVTTTTAEVGHVKIDRMKAISEDLFLMNTNDPEYSHSSAVTLNDDGTYEETEGLPVIGQVTGLEARVGGTQNIVQVNFNDDFHFKEGYYYQFKFRYNEILPAFAQLEPDAVPCEGDEVMTIKVVPAYAAWTGETGDLVFGSNNEVTGKTVRPNFNNDRNWRRVSSDELYWDGKNLSDGRRKYVTDGSNTSAMAYAPLDFTRVIIPDSAVDGRTGRASLQVFPYMYPAAENTTLRMNYDHSGTHTYVWPKNADPTEEDDLHAGVPENCLGAEGNMQGTPLNLDMAAYFNDAVLSSYKGVSCRPWYMNTCKEINFLPGSRIRQQQHLVYGRAWVDVELDEGRWHTLSSPLQNMVAGDMYLPKNTARQETERFEDITFSLDRNNRFHPSVFQRNWAQLTANVYKIDRDLGDFPVENVRVQAEWSHVFNDVKTGYDFGHGFSVKPDLTRLHRDGVRTTRTLFRFPKADTTYKYYTDEETPRSDREDAIGRDSIYRLNPVPTGRNGQRVTITNNAESLYFLVGNPFMTELDLTEFYNANYQSIEPKIWIMTADGQHTAIFDQTTGGFISDLDNDLSQLSALSSQLSVAPMQGFFVKAVDEEAVKTLRLTFSSKMMWKGLEEGYSPLRAPQLSTLNSQLSTMRIAACSGDTVFSTALLRVDPQASATFADSEDAELLYDPETRPVPTVYTIAGNMAASINSVPSADNVEVGLGLPDGDKDRTTTLRFTNVIPGYYLIDLADNSQLSTLNSQLGTPITEGMEYEVRGRAAGRLFISAGVQPEQVETIRITASGNRVDVSTGRKGLRIYVFDTQGRYITERTTHDSQVSFTLPAGIYIVEASDGVERKTAKIIIH